MPFYLGKDGRSLMFNAFQGLRSSNEEKDSNQHVVMCFSGVNSQGECRHLEPESWAKGMRGSGSSGCHSPEELGLGATWRDAPSKS